MIGRMITEWAFSIARSNKEASITELTISLIRLTAPYNRCIKVYSNLKQI